jgi:hypothetical protein
MQGAQQPAAAQLAAEDLTLPLPDHLVPPGWNQVLRLLALTVDKCLLRPPEAQQADCVDPVLLGECRDVVPVSGVCARTSQGTAGDVRPMYAGPLLQSLMNNSSLARQATPYQ